MIRIPERVTLRGRVWTITRPASCGGDGSMGLCNRRDRRLEIRADLEGEAALETYLHECLHAIWPYTVTNERAENLVIDNMDEAMVDVVLALVEGP